MMLSVVEPAGCHCLYPVKPYSRNLFKLQAPQFGIAGCSLTTGEPSAADFTVCGFVSQLMKLFTIQYSAFKMHAEG